ncbi:MAG: DUF624 domain-containing protein [Lachnospiraceae bacterium]|nr:DUF624 domain-containing protein [Lachnospiraceae bacterium]
MRFYNWATKLGGYVLLSFLWLIWCVPIFTIGASTTAYCSVLNKFFKNNEGYVLNNFWDAFTNDFKKSTKMTLVLLAGFALTAYNFMTMRRFSASLGSAYSFLMPIYIFIFVILIMVTIYVFAYNATFEDRIITIFKNSFLMGMRHLGTTIVILELDLLVLYIALEYSFVLRIFAPAIIGYVNMRLLNRVFMFYKPEDPTGRMITNISQMKAILDDNKRMKKERKKERKMKGK